MDEPAVNSLRLIWPSPLVSSWRKRASVLPLLPDPSEELEPVVPEPLPRLLLLPLPDVPEPVLVVPVPLLPVAPEPEVPEPDELDWAMPVAASARAVAMERSCGLVMYFFMVVGFRREAGAWLSGFSPSEAAGFPDSSQHPD